MALLGQPYWHAIAGLCSFTALFIALYQIISHLRNYTGPVFQRYIVRIIFMVPLYAVMSFLSLLMPHNSIYFDSVRDCYEAFVIYNFLSLCLAYVGGPGAVEVKMNGYQMEPSWLYWTCCLPPLPVNGNFVRLCKQGVLQFVLLKPPLAILQIVLYTQGAFHDGHWKPNDGFLWITIIYNITYSVALYALLLFYLGTHELLAPFNPLLKFAMVKLVVFLTFWQSLLVAVLAGVGVISSTEDQKNLQNFLICVEMLPAAFGMLFAFPFHEYKGTEPASGVGLGNMRHVISIHDVVSDTMHQFAPTYHDYVLYSNGGSGKEAPKKVRTKTFVAVGHETANKVGAKDHMNANLLANMELGVYQQSGSPRGTGDLGGGLAGGRSDDPVYQMRGTGESDDDLYARGPVEATEEEPNGFCSADIDEDDLAAAKKKKKAQKGAKQGILRRMEDDDEAGPADTELWLDGDPSPDIALRADASSSSQAVSQSLGGAGGQRPISARHAAPFLHGPERHSPQKQRLKLPPRQSPTGVEWSSRSASAPATKPSRGAGWDDMDDIDLGEGKP